MKSMFRLSLILILSLVPALAQARCDRPSQPAFPDPKTVEPALAEKLDQEMQHYAAGMNAYVACLTKEAQEADSDGSNTINFYNQKFLPEYNKRALAQ
jgi:hypothetical protein